VPAVGRVPPVAPVVDPEDPEDPVAPELAPAATRPDPVGQLAPGACDPVVPVEVPEVVLVAGLAAVPVVVPEVVRAVNVAHRAVPAVVAVVAIRTNCNRSSRPTPQAMLRYLPARS